MLPKSDVSQTHLQSRIKELEIESLALFPNEEERQDIADEVLVFTESIVRKRLYQKAIMPPQNAEFLTNEVNFVDERAPLPRVLAMTEMFISNTGLNPTSGRMFSYIPLSNSFHAAIGQYLAAITNSATAIYDINPGAVRIENKVIRWACDMVGYPKSSSGYLASGGSMATFEAVVCAREHANLKAVDYPKSVIYLTEHAHFAYQKSLQHAGLNEVIIRQIPFDDNFRMLPDKLDAQILEDKKNNLKPWMVIANGGTTGTGTIDPIRRISEITKQHGLWLHVDAAYGGFFNLIEEGKKKFDGIAEADSIVLDAHKSLFFPWAAGFVLVKERQHLINSNTYESSIIDAHHDSEDPEAISEMRLSLELSRPFRAYHIWFTLQCTGLAPFKAAQKEKLLLAQYFYENMQNNPHVECACPPDLTVVAFRIKSESDSLTDQLYHAINAEGRIHVSPVVLNKKMFIRFVPLSLQTHLEQVEVALVLINEKIREICHDAK